MIFRNSFTKRCSKIKQKKNRYLNIVILTRARKVANLSFT